MHWWGRQRGKLRRRSTAILTTTLSSRRPREANSRALSHASDSLVAAASKWARVLGSWEGSKRVCWRDAILGISQACWQWEAGAGSWGWGWLSPWLQIVLTLTMQGLVVSCTRGDQVNQCGAACSWGQVGRQSQLNSASDSSSSSTHR